MEATDQHDHLLPLSSHEDAKLENEALHLFETCWFFDNLLMNRKTKMVLRCNSDPCSATTNFSQELAHDKFEISSTPIVRVAGRNGAVDDPNLDSLLTPPVCQRALIEKPLRNGLYRTPSLPPIGREKFTARDGENYHATGSNKLTRQASLKNPPTNSLPPCITYKDTTRTSTTTKSCPQRISRAKSMNMDKINRPRHCNLNHVIVTRKSLSDLETEEVQGFKDLGFRFEEGDITPKVADILPGLQAKKRVDEAAILNVRRPYLSEAWALRQTYPHSNPNWVAKKSTEDMKADIKFWARAVASNVH